MKNTIRLALISASLAAGSSAAPFMAVGDGAELFITGTLGVRSDDNIFQAKKADSDVIFSINPGVDLTFGKNSQLKGNLTLVDSFDNYSDNSKLNTQLFGANFNSKYDDGKMKLGFTLGYNELNQNTVDIRGLTRRDVFNAGGTTEVEISQITSVGAGVTFNHENYKRRSYTDSDKLEVPIDFFYKWTPKTDLSVGYRYRDYKVDIGSDSTDHFFNVGARGEFSPKLTGSVHVGLNTRKLSKGGDDTQLGLDGNLSYELSPKTMWGFTASNDFGTSPQGQQQKNFSLGTTISTKISEEWAVNAGIDWRAIDYGTRTDDNFGLNLGASYIVNSNINIAASYKYTNYSSDIASGEFKQNIFTISANFRY